MTPLVTGIFKTAELFPHKQAIVCGDRIITYHQLTEKIRSAAMVLKQQAVQKEDRVILAASKTPSFVFGYFATHLLGAVAVPVDPEITEANLCYISNHINAKAAFTARPFENSPIKTQSIDHLDSELSLIEDNVHPSLEDISDILFTTGTTGQKKGVVLTHRNTLCAATNINTFIGNTADDREVLPLPLSHSFGLGRLRCTMLAGGTLILVDGFLKTRQIFDSIREWQATGFCFVPAGLQVLFRLSGDKLGDFANTLRYIEIGSAPMPRENKLRLMRLLPTTRICMHYGLTEASRAAFIEFHAHKSKLDSIGMPSPNVEISIRDDQGKTVDEGSLGRIHVRGGMVMRNYWNQPDLTREILQEGWLDTGDIGTMKDGFIYLKGRKSDLINVGGRKVSPVEIEDVLIQYPNITDCACIGVPDKDSITGESIKAFICMQDKTTLDIPTLMRFLHGKLENYKLPQKFEVIDKIPKTASGKTQRQLLPRDGS